MRIRLLLPLLCLICTATISYAQHEATPRREIRHKLKHYPISSEQVEDNSEFTIHPSQLSTRASGEYIMKQFPTTGEIKGVVILAAFADVPFSNDTVSTLLRNRYNADNYTEEISFNEYSEHYGKYCDLEVTLPGSARDYFRSMSFGRFVPSFDVIGPVTLDNPRAYYGANTSSGNDKNTSGMIREACQKAYDLGLTDFSDYDNDGDGVVDVVYVVYAGSDEAQTGIEECIWAKASSITQTLGDMKIGRYACSSELVIDLPVVAGIGTFVHEFSHILGLPDFYNTKADDFTMDVWSVMDYGMYNAEGFVPCAYTAFERYSLGWLPMQTLNEPATMNIGTTEDERQGYRIFTANLNSGTTPTEADTASFYLAETICREGWNRYAAAEGLLISEVTYLKSAWTNNTLNAGTQHRHCIVPANNDYNYRTANKHLFGTVNHEFTLTSTPASITQFGAVMDKPLTDIHYDQEEGKTFFRFRGGEDDKYHAVTYMVDGEVYRIKMVASGALLPEIAAPAKVGHTFCGWGGLPEVMPEENIIVTGMFTVNKYLATFTIADEVIASDSLEYGAPVVPPDVPGREGYTFSGWGDVVATMPAGDVAYNATYTVNTYKVHYYADDELVHTAHVAYGDTIPQYTYTPADESHTFMGWIGETYDTMPAHDVIYTANIESGINAMPTDNGQQTTVIYDLQGRRVQHPTKGVYIVNGKKVVIK